MNRTSHSRTVPLRGSHPPPPSRARLAAALAAASLALPLLLLPRASGAASCERCPPVEGGGGAVKAKAPAAVPAPEADPLAELARSKKRVVIADFGQGLCKQCRKQGEILDEVRKAYGDKVEIRFVHVGKEAALAERYDVSMIPYLVYIDPSGKVRATAAGVSTFEKISAQLAKLGVRR